MPYLKILTITFLLSFVVGLSHADQVVKNLDGSLSWTSDPIIPETKTLTIEEAKALWEEDKKKLEILKNEIATYDLDYTRMIQAQEGLIQKDQDNFKQYIDEAAQMANTPDLIDQ